MFCFLLIFLLVLLGFIHIYSLIHTYCFNIYWFIGFYSGFIVFLLPLAFIMISLCFLFFCSFKQILVGCLGGVGFVCVWGVDLWLFFFFLTWDIS